jgi:uncharacterized protein (TIGR02145 family)
LILIYFRYTKSILMLRSLLSLVLLSLVGITVSAQYASDWNPDADGDNAIGVNDLLALLSVFEETDSDNDGIFDSQDDCVGVFDACGVCNGSGVDVDADGVCDDADPCLGALDVCGVCNGPGPNFPVIDEIVYVTDSLFVPPLGTWYVFSYAVDTLYNYVCPVQGCMDATAGNFNPAAVIDNGSCTYGPAQCGGASTVTFDGHTYALVGIGMQCWFKENLRSDNYRNGDPIPGNLANSQWTSTGSGAQAVYDNDQAYLSTYGRVYNWYAVNDARGLCPAGWHVPSDGEWMELEMELGMTFAQANATGWRGTDQGAQMKSSPSDTPPWNGTGSSGFSALPGGVRNVHGGYIYGGIAGNLWTSSANETDYVWYRSITSEYGSVYRVTIDLNGLRSGNSVRCLKD